MRLATCVAVSASSLSAVLWLLQAGLGTVVPSVLTVSAVTKPFQAFLGS